MITGHRYHDDIQGILQTATAGVTAYTMRQYRNTGIVMPHVAQGDVWAMIFQFSHRKQLETVCDSVHLHYIPIAAANGDIQINYEWGWYNPNDGSIIPDTLPNTGSKVITLSTTDQYKLKISGLINNLQYPDSEDYSSLLFVKCTRVAPSGTNWGAINEFAIGYMDAHFSVTRFGSYNEYSDP